MANYNVDIAVALKGAKQLTAFNKNVEKTSTQVKGLNQQLKNTAKDQKLFIRNFENLNSVLANAKASFNAVASGTLMQKRAARELVVAERELNKEYQQRERLLESIRRNQSGFAQFSRSASQVSSPTAFDTATQKSIDRNRRKQNRIAGRTSVPFGPQPFIGPMPMLPMQGPILPSAAASIRRAQARTLPSQGGDFGFGLAGDPIAKSIRRNKQKQFRELLKEKKANKDIRDIKARQLRLDRAQNRALKERVITTRTLAKTSQSTGGGMGGRGFFRGGARGALSNAMIGGGFPLLFGQGALGAVGGGVGGALGGAIGGGFGFSLSIIGTAIAQRIQEAIDFRKEIEKVNVAIEKTGGTSRLTATDITFLAKNMNVTKEEALQAANAFAAFGAQSSLALAETFRDRSTFNLYANLNKDAKTFITTVDTLFQKNELGIKQAKQSLQILEEKGLKEASIFAEAINNEKKIREELEAVKPSKEDEARAARVTLSIFDPDTLRHTKEFMMLSEKAQKIQLKLATAEGQLENRLGTLEERFEKRLALVKENIKAQRDFNEAVERALIMQAPKDELEKLLDPLMQVDALSRSIGASFSESFKGIVRGSMTAQDALRNLFNKTADHFLDMAAQILAAQIRSGIMGLFGSLFNPFGPTMGGEGYFNPVTGLGTAGPNYGLADGGTARSGRSYLVGERGPEIFTPKNTGTVIPNHELGGMGSSTNIVVNVDASGSSVEGDEEQSRELGRIISVAIQSELIKQKRPGGMLA